MLPPSLYMPMSDSVVLSLPQSNYRLSARPAFFPLIDSPHDSRQRDSVGQIEISQDVRSSISRCLEAAVQYYLHVCNNVKPDSKGLK